MKPNRTRILPSMLMLTLVGLLLTLFSSFGLPLAHAFVNGQAANLVLGQPNFNSETQSTTDAGMNGPNGVAVDPTTGKFFVADANNNRILRFASAASLTNGAVAEGVFGQADFTSSSANRGFTTPDAKRLLDPSGVAVGSDGTLWVADASNHRVLRFDNAATRTPDASGDLGAANGVLGQANFVSGWINRSSMADANTLNYPTGVAVGSDGTTLWVADYFNNRVLRFDNAATRTPDASGDLGAANGVLGQALFTSSTSGTTANTMKTPGGVAVASNGTLWVADSGNNRVLRFASTTSLTDGASADGVLGQADFVSGVANRAAGPDANTMMTPTGMAVGSDGTLWVADTNNSRVLRFINAASKTNGDPADGVLGQADFVSNGYNRDGTADANSLGSPFNMVVSNGSLWVTDFGSHRMLRYNTNDNLSSLTLSSGTLSPAFAASTTSYTASVANNVNSITVTPTVSDVNTTVTVNGGSAATPVSLTVGANTITIVVTLPDGITTETYTVTVTRDSASTSTNAATSVSANGATVSATVNANNFSATVSFELTTISGNYTSPTSLPATPATVTGSIATAVSADATGLLPATTYYYRVVAVSSTGTTNGTEQSFTTTSLAPTVTNTPTATATSTNTPTVTNTPTATATSTNTPTVTNTPTATSTNTPMVTATSYQLAL